MREIADKSEEKTPLVDETKAEDVTDAKDKSKETTPSQNAKALLRDKLLSSKTEEHDEPKAKASSDEKTIAVSDIDVRLAEYERRLAKAKQTATQMWH